MAVRVAVPATGSAVSMVVTGTGRPIRSVPMSVLLAGPVSVLGMSGTGTVATPARSAVPCRAVAAPWVGRRIGGLLCRGHRPIIARTAGAPCSPRPN